jgi:hypothetical protein
LIKLVQRAEDQQELDKSDLDFRQRILAASRGPLTPDLYERLFEDEDEVHTDHAGIWQPTSEEEFNDMIAEWESAAVSLQTFPTGPVGLGLEESLTLAKTLGFKVSGNEHTS